MSRKNTKTYRFLQKKISDFMQKLQFKTSHISQGGKIILLWVIICGVSLLMPWISPLDSIISCWYSDVPSSSSFSGILWHVGIFILFALCIISFWVFSIQNKQKFHFFSTLQISDQVSSFYGSFFILIFSLHSFFVVHGLKFFSVNIVYGKGIILCLTWAIVILTGSFILKKEYRKNIKGSYYNESHWDIKQQNNEEQKNNMKLPF